MALVSRLRTICLTRLGSPTTGDGSPENLTFGSCHAMAWITWRDWPARSTRTEAMSSRPMSARAAVMRSSMRFMTSVPSLEIVSTISVRSAAVSPSSTSLRCSAKPTIAVSGVLISCETEARKWSFDSTSLSRPSFESSSLRLTSASRASDSARASSAWYNVEARSSISLLHDPVPREPGSSPESRLLAIERSGRST